MGVADWGANGGSEGGHYEEGGSQNGGMGVTVYGGQWMGGGSLNGGVNKRVNGGG